MEITPIASAGTIKQQIQATFDPSFFALVSEHLYSSPNKAFEELITNSWDADACNVYVTISSDLNLQESTISILDDGTSMNVNGFEKLWSIGKSDKRITELYNRKKIGKFGIGKLATYLLCNELTYICNCGDGKIRVVTMDYRKIDAQYEKDQNSLKLDVRELEEGDLQQLLLQYNAGDAILDLIKKGVPSINSATEYYDEYGGKQVRLEKSMTTWTLAILTSLKESGRNIEIGRTKWMLRTALPLGASMKIKYNQEEIHPSKLEGIINEQWPIGPDLPFESITLENGEVITLDKRKDPYPSVVLPEIGEITGTISLFMHSIATGKSNKMDSSNGCFVNVLGRVINTNGIGQFSVGSSGQGTFAKFRAAVRVDSLDGIMTIQRDTLKESRELSIVSAFLSKAFNYVRNLEENANAHLLIAASKSRKGSLSAIPLTNVALQLQSSIEDISHLPSFIDVKNAIDEEKITSWLKQTSEGQQDAITGIELLDENPNEPVARYDLTSRIIKLNKNHPFVQEHSTSPEQLAVLEDMVIVNILSDSYLLSNGVSDKIVKDMNTYRDISQRAVAQLRRNSPIVIIQLLEQWHDQAKPLEEIVGDALSYLGYSVERLAKSGEPEGLATAFITPQQEGKQMLYRITYDAKSTKKKKVQTGNVHSAGLARHRANYGANYSLVVGPDFQSGALEEEAEANGITPMTTSTLGKLLGLTISYGSLSLADLEEVFKLRAPEHTKVWVTELETKLKLQEHFTISNLAQALQAAQEPHGFDILDAAVVAKQYREIIDNSKWPLTSDVIKIIQSLAQLAPRTIGVDSSDNHRIFLLASPAQLLNEIKRQTAQLPESAKVGVLETA